MAALHTALHLGPPQLKRIRIVPDSGSLEEGARWMLPHVDAYNMVSFDTESCHRQGGLAFSIFGAMDGYALIVDHRSTGNAGLEAPLRSLVKGRLVLGSGISRQDSKLLYGIPCKLGDTQELSRSIQLHSLYPYQAHGCAPGQKTGLKHIPEMLFGHCYGPLGLVTRKGASSDDEDYQERQGFPQPFDWPSWLYPTKMYTFKTSRPSQEQIAYMYNDAVSPFLHVMMMTMLQLVKGDLGRMETVPEALSLTARKFFGDLPSSEPGNTESDPNHQEAAKKEVHPVDQAPDLWSSLGGIPPGVSDEALLDALMYLPDDILTKIQNFQHLDTEDTDDAEFIELYGGLFTLARAANVIEDHGLLDGVHDKGITKSRDSGQSTSDEAYGSDVAATPNKRKVILVSVSTDTDSPPASKVTAETGSQTDSESRTENVSVQASPIPAKRRKIEVEISAEDSRLVAHIPIAAALEQLESATERCGPEDGSAAKDNLPPSSSGSGSEDAQGVDTQDNPLSSPADAHIPAETLIKPQDLPESDRLRLLGGRIEHVDVPHMTTIPSRFGATPDFEPRCHQCGHKQDFNKPHRVHPVDACPVIRKYGQEAYDPSQDRWTALPCLYPLCSRPAPPLY